MVVFTVFIVAAIVVVGTFGLVFSGHTLVVFTVFIIAAVIIIRALKLVLHRHTLPVATHLTGATIFITVTLVFHGLTHSVVTFPRAPTVVVVGALGFFDRPTRKRDTFFIRTAIFILVALEIGISAFAVVTLFPCITDIASTGGATFAVVTGFTGSTLLVVGATGVVRLDIIPIGASGLRACLPVFVSRCVSSETRMALSQTARKGQRCCQYKNDG